MASIGRPGVAVIARDLMPSHAFSRLLTPSHAFSRLLTPSPPSQVADQAAMAFGEGFYGYLGEQLKQGHASACLDEAYRRAEALFLERGFRKGNPNPAMVNGRVVSDWDGSFVLLRPVRPEEDSIREGEAESHDAVLALRRVKSDAPRSMRATL